MNNILGPQKFFAPVDTAFASTRAEELAQPLHRTSADNSNDLVDAIATGHGVFGRERWLPQSAEFSQAWPRALYILMRSRSEGNWERHLAQKATAHKAAYYQVIAGGGALRWPGWCQLQRSPCENGPAQLCGLGPGS